MNTNIARPHVSRARTLCYSPNVENVQEALIGRLADDARRQNGHHNSRLSGKGEGKNTRRNKRHERVTMKSEFFLFLPQAPSPDMLSSGGDPAAPHRHQVRYPFT